MNRFIVNNLPWLFNRFANEDSPNENNNMELTVSNSNNRDESTSIGRHEFKEKTFSDCKDISEALHLFDISSIKYDLELVEETLLLNINIEGPFEKLRQSEVQKLSKKCKNKSIVVLFASTNEDNFAVYWKSKELHQFLTLSHFSDTASITDKSFYIFLANFLAESLNNGHLGLLNSVVKSVEKDKCVQLHLIADACDFNLLFIAAKLGRNDIVKILLDQDLKTELFIEGQEIKVQDLAWEAHHHDIVLNLLKAGATYPKSFDANQCLDELKEFCEASEELHTAIKEGKEIQIIEILNQTTNPHPFYNRSSESAAKIALDNKLIKIYELLTTRKVFLGRHEFFHNFWGNFSDLEKEMLRKIHFKNSVHTPEKHLNDLTNSSSVSHDDKKVQANLSHIHYAFEILNQIPCIRIILMIVAASKKLKILFDFKSYSVYVVDPTANYNMRGLFYLKGIICIAAGFLLDPSSESETFGTLTHELCHYAMVLVYKNLARPYKRKDRERYREFERIAKICLRNRNKEKLIDLVFAYPRKMQHAELIVRVPHLMALYHNQPEKLKETRENFIELFNYYEQKVVLDMERKLPRIQKRIERLDTKILKNKIITIGTVILSIIAIIATVFAMWPTPYRPDNKLSRFFELSPNDQTKIENASIMYKNVEIRFRNLFSSSSLAYHNLTSDHISQMLNGRKLNLSDSQFLYLTALVSHNWQNLTEKLKQKFLKSNFTFQNETLEFEKLDTQALKAFEFLTSEQIMYVLDEKVLSVDKIVPNKTKIYVDRSFRDIEIEDTYSKYKNHVYMNQREFYIRNNNSSINEEEYRESIMKLYKSEEKFKEFYYNTFKKNQNTSANENSDVLSKILEYEWIENENALHDFKIYNAQFEDIVKLSQITKIFILSSEAGAGKTTTFQQFTISIKKKFPTRWVTYIDLKEHTKYYNKNDYLENVLGLLEEVLNLKSKSDFEKKFFSEYFKLGQVVFLWDGFDEISPIYSDFILNITDSIYRKTNNVQYVSTRPKYIDQLMNRFGPGYHVLVPFIESQRNEFLRKFFSFYKIDDESIKAYSESFLKIANILKDSLMHWESSKDFNSPLLLETISNITLNEDKNNRTENLYEIYQKFILKNIEIWKTKSDFAKEYADQSFTSRIKFDIMEMYQMYALKNQIIKYDFESRRIARNLKIMNLRRPLKLTYEEISRVGILNINHENEFHFTTNSFAEFFVAQFFIENVYNANPASEDSELIIQLFFYITEKYELKQKIITNFISFFLQTSNNTESFDPKIAAIFRIKYKSIFFSFLWSRNIKIFEFLFNFFKKDHRLLIDLLQIDENETLYTAAFNRAFFGDYDYNFDREKLKELGKGCLTKEEFEKFISGRNQKGIILYNSYIFYKDHYNTHDSVFLDFYNLPEEILQNDDKMFVFETLIKNLTENELKELLLSTTSPIIWDLPSFIGKENFWSIFDSSLTNAEKKIMTSNIFQKISKSRESSNLIPFLFNKTENFLSSSEIIEILMNKNTLHWAAANNFETFEEFWKLIINHVNETQQKEILLHRVNGECFDYLYKISPNEKCYFYPSFNIFHNILIFVDNTYENKIHNLIEFYEKYFSKTEMQNIITNSNDFFPYFIMNNWPNHCEIFAKYLENLFNGDKNSLKKFLLEHINQSNLNLFEYIKSFEYSYSDRLKPFSDLLQSS